jgi:creatinine amidohydrolase
MTSMKFEELHPDELKTVIKSSGIVYLPLGTLEWHEKHLPFGTDAFESYALCLASCKKTGGCVIPSLYFGTDREHRIGKKVFHGMDARAGKVLPGSIYFLKEKQFYHLVNSIAQNIALQGFRKLVIVSAHAGSAQIRVITKLAKVGVRGMKILVFHGKGFPCGMDHAGKMETSLLMQVNKRLVSMSRLPNPYKGILTSDPHKARKKLGKESFDMIIEQVVKEVKKR